MYSKYDILYGETWSNSVRLNRSKVFCNSYKDLVGNKYASAEKEVPKNIGNRYSLEIYDTHISIFPDLWERLLLNADISLIKIGKHFRL